jgi:hypothetical protein
MPEISVRTRTTNLNAISTPMTDTDNVTSDAMRMHIERLLTQYEIHHYWITRMDKARALRDLVFGVRIWTPRIKGERTYALALHEIGHILGDGQDSPDVMTREREAWQWARANALKWTPKMERHAARCLLAYERHEQKLRTREAELRALLAVGDTPLKQDDVGDRDAEWHDKWMRENADDLWEEGE